jgi:hypothetical protein
MPAENAKLVDIVVVTRAFSKVAAVFGGLVGRFASWAGDQVMSLLQIIFEVVAPAVMPYIRKAMGAFRQIVRNPVGFVGNLVRAGVQGFRQFAARFLEHLRGALIGWLTGSLAGAGLYIPQAFEIREIIKASTSLDAMYRLLESQNLEANVHELAVAEDVVRHVDQCIDGTPANHRFSDRDRGYTTRATESATGAAETVPTTLDLPRRHWREPCGVPKLGYGR